MAGVVGVTGVLGETRARASQRIQRQGSRMTDGDLLNRYLRERSGESLTELVRRHQALVYGACLRILGGSHDAEDAAQAVLLLLMRKAPSLSSRTDLTGWLYLTAVGVAQNARRLRIRRKKHEQEAGAMQPTTLESRGESLRDAVRPRLDEALARLPEAQRQVVLLRYFRGLSREESAGALGCSVKTLDNRLAGALERLRRMLSGGGLAISAEALMGFLNEVLPTPVPEQVAALLQSVCRGESAASSGAQTLLEGFMRALRRSQFKLCSAGAAAVLALVAVPILLTASGTERAPVAGEAGPLAPLQDAPSEKKTAALQPFVPKGGKIVARLRLPNRAPWVRKLLWSPDGQKLLAVIDNAIKVTDFSVSKNGPEAYEIYGIDLEKQKVESLWSGAGMPEWLSGGRVLVRLGQKLCLFSADRNSKHEFPGKSWQVTRTSSDGRYVVYVTGDKGEKYERQPQRLFSVEDGTLLQLAPPCEKPADAQLTSHLGFWTPTGKYCLATLVGKEEIPRNRGAGPSGPRVDVPGSVLPQGAPATPPVSTVWLYDPAAKKFAPTDKYRTFGSFLSDRTRHGAELMRANGDWVRLVLADQSVPRDLIRIEQGAAPVAAVETTDDFGKVLKRVELDRKALGPVALHMHALSADGRYLLASTYTKVRRSSGGDYPDLETGVLVDLETGRLVPGFDAKGVKLLHARPMAVMSATREVLVLTRNEDPWGMWAIPFDGGSAKDHAPLLGLPCWSPDSDGTVAWGERHPMPFEMMADPDRLAVLATPLNFANVLDPKYRNEPWRLMVFYNSATPLEVHRSQGRADRAANVAWSPQGDRLAFTSGDTLFVWQPTAEATAAPVIEKDAARPKDEDF